MTSHLGLVYISSKLSAAGEANEDKLTFKFRLSSSASSADYLSRDILRRTLGAHHSSKSSACQTSVGITYEDNRERVDYISTHHFRARS